MENTTKVGLFTKLLGSISGVLGGIFFILKLTDKIDWKWIWVLAPLWIPTGIATITIGIAVVWYLKEVK